MEFIIISILTLLLISAAGIVIFLTRKQHPQASPDAAQSILLIQQHVESLRSDLRNSIQHLTENVNHQLSSVNQQIQSQTHTVGNRLDNAARLISDVQKNIGELATATQEIKELGQSVSKLEELLRAPKLRGGLGEFLLEDLLKQVLPSEHYEMQYHFRDGSVVDAIIRTSNRMVPIDSKFPLENFRKMLSTSNEVEKKGYQKAFFNDVKKHIDAIATKYILPDEGTFPFALMYIPAENIYYEVMIKDESTNGSGVYSHAISRKVIPVSPNSFYAYLQVITLGLRGLYIEHRAHEILDVLSHLQGDVGRIRECFDTLGTHLDNARKKYEETDKRFSNFEGRLDHISEHKLTDNQARQTQSDLLLI